MILPTENAVAAARSAIAQAAVPTGGFHEYAGFLHVIGAAKGCGSHGGPASGDGRRPRTGSEGFSKCPSDRISQENSIGVFSRITRYMRECGIDMKVGLQFGKCC